MIAGFANVWTLWSPPATTAPKPQRRHAPVLMGDILTSRGDVPDLLLRWREDRDKDSTRDKG